jgi:hypothetical protein
VERGEAAHMMLMAAAAGRPFEESGVPQTARNRDLFRQIEAEVAAVPDGHVVGIPFDHSLMK